MINNKKGLSTVLTTLIIILLVLVAIGIVWVVIRGVLETGTGDIGTSVKCLDVDVKATKVECTVGLCNTTVERSAGGEDISGINLIFSEEDGEANFVRDVIGNIAPLESKTELNVDTGLTTPNKVEVAVYFTDESGEKQICSGISVYNF